MDTAVTAGTAGDELSASGDADGSASARGTRESPSPIGGVPNWHAASACLLPPAGELLRLSQGLFVGMPASPVTEPRLAGMQSGSSEPAGDRGERGGARDADTTEAAEPGQRGRGALAAVAAAATATSLCPELHSTGAVTLTESPTFLLVELRLQAQLAPPAVPELRSLLELRRCAE